jgi:hypothetical protein
VQLFQAAEIPPTFGKPLKAPYRRTFRPKSMSDVDSLYSSRDATANREVRSCVDKVCYLFKQFLDNLGQFCKT